MYQHHISINQHCLASLGRQPCSVRQIGAAPCIPLAIRALIRSIEDPTEREIPRAKERLPRDQSHSISNKMIRLGACRNLAEPPRHNFTSSEDEKCAANSNTQNSKCFFKRDMHWAKAFLNRKSHCISWFSGGVLHSRRITSMLPADRNLVHSTLVRLVVGSSLLLH
ncbi:hypothetical protein BJ741DRAFT_373664 [Chytriomyces cf. hyalinus JEL632]|nr:hypothetical protein BJ741DRAFT_373664 [Chytriomyces cf. hyalinus JEL632]